MQSRASARSTPDAPVRVPPRPGQLTRIAATFIGQGLAAGDQLLYVTTDGHAEAVLGALPGDVRADDAVVAGQLVISSFADAYGTRRPDDLGAVADGFRAAAEQSRKRGFPGCAWPPRWTSSPRCSARPRRCSAGSGCRPGCNARSASARCASTTPAGSTTSTPSCSPTSTPASRPRPPDPARQLPRGGRALGAADLRRGRHLQPRPAAPHAPVAGGGDATGCTWTSRA